MTTKNENLEQLLTTDQITSPNKNAPLYQNYHIFGEKKELFSSFFSYQTKFVEYFLSKYS